MTRIATGSLARCVRMYSFAMLVMQILLLPGATIEGMVKSKEVLGFFSHPIKQSLHCYILPCFSSCWGFTNTQLSRRSLRH